MGQDLPMPEDPKLRSAAKLVLRHNRNDSDITEWNKFESQK